MKLHVKVIPFHSTKTFKSKNKTARAGTEWYVPCVGVWRGRRSPAPSAHAVQLLSPGFWCLCSSDQVSMDLDSWFVKERKENRFPWLKYYSRQSKNAFFVCFILNSNHSVSLSTNYRQPVQFFDSCNFSVRLLALPQVTVREKKEEKKAHLSPHHSFNRKLKKYICSSINNQYHIIH